MRSVRVFAPASASNLGPGFDVIGLALHRPGDIVEAELAEGPDVEIVEVTGGDGTLTRNACENVAGVAARHVLRRLREEQRGSPPPSAFGVRLRLHKGMPLQSGLGSSAASSVAGAFAVNELFDRPFTRLELLASAMEGERVACGSAHADNVAPSLLGGLVLVRSYTPLEVVQLPVPPDLHVVVTHPHCRVATADARALLDTRSIRLEDAVSNLGNVAAFVSAVYEDDLALLGRSVIDRLAEPARAALIPGFHAVQAAALASGALGCSIAGSGPSMFAFSRGGARVGRIAEAMREAFREAAGLTSDVYAGRVNLQGARVLAAGEEP
jgi:homoserine kinase